VAAGHPPRCADAPVGVMAVMTAVSECGTKHRSLHGARRLRRGGAAVNLKCSPGGTLRAGPFVERMIAVGSVPGVGVEPTRAGVPRDLNPFPFTASAGQALSCELSMDDARTSDKKSENDVDFRA
jgi:hypothetical protein